MIEPLLHLVPASEFDIEATEAYAPSSLDVEGFVHCATLAQVAGMARMLFAGTADLLLLVLDPRALDAAVQWEDRYGIGQTFPHVYGPVPRAAIVDVIAFPPGPGGRWSRPVLALLREGRPPPLFGSLRADTARGVMFRGQHRHQLHHLRGLAVELPHFVLAVGVWPLLALARLQGLAATVASR
jgi:uncharacterized protein (DUF952 family)